MKDISGDIYKLSPSDIREPAEWMSRSQTNATRTDSELGKWGNKNLSPSSVFEVDKGNPHRQTADIDQLNVGKY